MKVNGIMFTIPMRKASSKRRGSTLFQKEVGIEGISDSGLES